MRLCSAIFSAGEIGGKSTLELFLLKSFRMAMESFELFGLDGKDLKGYSFALVMPCADRNLEAIFP